MGAFVLGAWLLVMTLSASAQTGLTLQLVPETTAIVPGQPFRVGLFIQHQPGWHTYWRQPGIVGVPTALEWDLPAGFKAGKLEYPEPESVLMFRIKAQGYERDVLLQTEIIPPANLKLGHAVTLKATATWMCCGNSCHPGHMGLSLKMATAEASQLDSQWHPLFEKERQAYARSSQSWTATAVEKGLQVTLTLQPTGNARPFTSDEKILFFTEDGWINSDEPQPQELLPDGSMVVQLTRADVYLGKTVPDQLVGVVQRKGGWVEGQEWRSLTVLPLLQR